MTEELFHAMRNMKNDKAPEKDLGKILIEILKLDNECLRQEQLLKNWINVVVVMFCKKEKKPTENYRPMSLHSKRYTSCS